MTLTTDTAANLYDYRTGAFLRAATPAEEAASIAAAEVDGGHGLIIVEGVTCYVQD